MRGNRTDLYFEKNGKKLNANISVSSFEDGSFMYRLLSFTTVDNKLKNTFQKELQNYLSKISFHHVLVAGLGSENYTADSVGPKTLRYIKANAYLEYLGIPVDLKVSALEPGVLGETGIETRRIIESIVDEINPDIILFIDSYVTENIDYLNHTIEISNAGITPGSGIRGLNEEINQKTLGIPIIVIGVPTAVEVCLPSKEKEQHFTYHLSTSDVDTYVEEIAELIGTSIHDVLYHNFDISTPE